MKQNPYYALRMLDGIPYLLPFGQSIADHRRGTRLNETGVYLWSILKEDRSMEQLLSLAAEYFEASEEELPELKADLQLYLDELIRLGAVLPDQDPWTLSASYSRTLRIAGLTLRLEGPSEVFSDRFSPFACAEEASTPDMVITAFAGICTFVYPGEMILRSHLLSILDCGTHFEMQFHANQQLKTMILKKDGSKAILYYSFPHGEVLEEEIFHGIREAFLYLGIRHGMAAIHSTSILYRDKAWLFSGHSGMGKSTHAALWKEQFRVPVLNGDLNLIAIRDGKPVIYGIPWCGTSGISDTNTYELGGILLLKRDTHSHIRELSKPDQVLLVDQRLISHSWTSELFDRNLQLIQKIAPGILICTLYCTKDPEAAMVSRARIDAFCSSAKKP